jgi:hypothetical protein
MYKRLCHLRHVDNFSFLLYRSCGGVNVSLKYFQSMPVCVKAPWYHNARVGPRDRILVESKYYCMALLQVGASVGPASQVRSYAMLLLSIAVNRKVCF